MPSLGRVFGKLIPIPIPPPLSDEAALLTHLGLGAKELKKIWHFRTRMYSRFSISKGAGKVRTISAPDWRLKMLQHRLLPLLNQLYRLRSPVHGYVPDRSVKTNAEAHGRRRFVVNLDLKDYFPTITENRVRGLLRSLAIDPRVAEIVARLCCVNNHLPQGAPTSPSISNMVCYRLDTVLQQIAKDARAIYTRYADDITFSSYQPPAPLFEGAIPRAGRFSPDLLASNLKEAFAANGFTIHPEKAHYADRNSRRIVTGVKINAGLNVDRRYVRNIRAALHSVEKFGLIAAQKKFAAASGKSDLAAHLRGRISYVAHLKGQTDPVVRSLAIRYNKSFSIRPINLTPTAEERRDRAVWVIDDAERGLQGSAFFLSGVGLVTAAHCVDGVNETELLHPSKHTTIFKVKVLNRDKDRDLALLDHGSIPVTEYFELEAAVRPVAVRDAVTAYGYPKWAPGDRLNTRPGNVSLLTPKFGVSMIEVTQELTQGMSGGPIIDAHGGVVGIIHKGGPAEGRQLAIHLSVVRDWLEK